MGSRVALCCAAVALVVCSLLAGPARPLAAPGPVARVAACAQLGAADHFAVFSHGVFKAAQVGGTTITGRIAAGSTVTLDGVSVGPGVGDEPPTVITGASLVAGK